jgi:hypothetical protein
MYFFVGFAVIQAFGRPTVPARGEFCRQVDSCLTMTSVFLSIVLTFFVLDATYLNKRFVHYLGLTDTHWPHGTADPLFKAYAPQWKPDAAALTEYQDIRLIAARTKVVGEVIYYPFAIFFLMVLARNPLFDDWDWPVGLVIVLVANITLAVIGALMLRREAEKARRQAIEKMNRRLIGYKSQGTADGAEQKAAVMTELIEQVENERDGAFSILSQHPILAAILLPTGSVGLWVLVEYTARTLG